MRPLLLAFIVVPAFLGRCSEDEVLLRENEFILKVNGVFETGDLKLQLTGIRDSRCPKDVECVWAGNATTTLVLEGPGSSPENSGGQTLRDTVQLCIGACGKAGFLETDSDTLAVGGARYELTLLEVSPYPGAGKKGQEKTARYRLEAFAR